MGTQSGLNASQTRGTSRTAEVTVETRVGFPCLVSNDAMALVPMKSLLRVWWKQKQITFCLFLGKFLLPDR